MPDRMRTQGKEGQGGEGRGQRRKGYISLLVSILGEKPFRFP